MSGEEVKQQTEDETYESIVEDLRSGGEKESEEDQPETVETEAEKPLAPTEFDIDGEKVTPDTVKEWKLGYMKDADYRQKTAAIARERERIELMRRELEDEFYNRKAYQPPMQAGYAQPQDEPIEFATPTEKRLYDELQQVKGAVGSLYERDKQAQARAIEAQINESIDGFMRKHPEVDENKMAQIMAKANKHKVRAPSVEVFEDLHRSMIDEAEIEKRAVEKYLTEQKKKKPAAMEPASALASEPEPPDIKNLSEDQLFNLMLRDLKQHR